MLNIMTFFMKHRVDKREKQIIYVVDRVEEETPQLRFNCEIKLAAEVLNSAVRQQTAHTNSLSMHL